MAILRALVATGRRVLTRETAGAVYGVKTPLGGNTQRPKLTPVACQRLRRRMDRERWGYGCRQRRAVCWKEVALFGKRSLTRGCLWILSMRHSSTGF